MILSWWSRKRKILPDAESKPGAESKAVPDAENETEEDEVCAICLDTVSDNEWKCHVCSCKLHHSCQARWSIRCPVCGQKTKQMQIVSSTRTNCNQIILRHTYDMVPSAEPYHRRWMTECSSNGHILFLDKHSDILGEQVVVRCTRCQREEQFDWIFDPT